MTGYSIAINAWGVHTILHKALNADEAKGWQAALREAAERCDWNGRAWSVVADVRGLNSADGAAFLPTVAPVLVGLVGRSEVERCAVIAADDGQAEAVGRIAGGTGAARKTRILAVEGRDRVQIAAAYGWTLNGTEPSIAHRPRTGAVVPFPVTVNRAAPAALFHKALRKAS